MSVYYSWESQGVQNFSGPISFKISAASGSHISSYVESRLNK